MNQQIPKVGRLAFRREGRQWNAYCALPDSMKDAVFLGSVAMAAVEKNPALKKAFMGLMKAVVGELLPGAEWPMPPVAAPEHERGGAA